MKVKTNRLEALRLIISSQQLGSQDELLNALQKEGFKLTQATLSRDLKQLKVAKAASMSGNKDLQTIGDLSKNYDGVRVGFDLKR